MKSVKAILILTLISFGLQTEVSAQLLPTNLKITVLDELGNAAEGATVSIYVTKEDYLNSSNAVAKGTTNAKGLVKFKKLEPKAYFIEATKGDLKNDGLGATTEPLTEKRTNKVNVVIQ